MLYLQLTSMILQTSFLGMLFVQCNIPFNGGNYITDEVPLPSSLHLATWPVCLP